jgi:hypothetical protein
MKQARAFLAVCVVGLTLAASAHAQSDAVLAHYQAYNAAIERGDLAAAETAGAAALQASQAQDGGGGATAGLAANLAQVRIDQGKLEEAREPARLAFTLAQQRGAASGVNPVYARMLFAHANLETRSGPEEMHAALAQAQGEVEMSGPTYRSALRFGDWALRENAPLDAARAYDVAVTLANGTSASDLVARAEALVGRGIARAMADRAMSGRVLTGTRLANRPDQRADADLIEALRITRPIAEREARLRGYARSQVVFGAALAWAHARRMTMNALGWQDPYPAEHMRSLVVDLNADDGVPACPVDATTPPPDYPSEEVDRHGASALVARFVTDGSGAITDAKLVGSSGATDLVRATIEVLPRWRVSAGGAGCSQARVIFLPVHIIIDDVQNSERVMGGGRGSTRTWVRRQDRGILALPRD